MISLSNDAIFEKRLYLLYHSSWAINVVCLEFVLPGYCQYFVEKKNVSVHFFSFSFGLRFTTVLALCRVHKDQLKSD